MAKYLKPKDELRRTSDWASHYFIREGYHFDYTIKSLSEVDRLFLNSLDLFLKSENTNYILAISSYIGEVFIRRYRGKWKINENPDIEIRSVSVVLKNKHICYPFELSALLLQRKCTLEGYLNEHFTKK